MSVRARWERLPMAAAAGDEEAAHRRTFGQWFRLNVLGNLPLLLGALIVGGLVGLALLAPMVSPHNPLQEQRLYYQDGRWLTAPFAPSSIFPLGTDTQ